MPDISLTLLFSFSLIICQHYFIIEIHAVTIIIAAADMIFSSPYFQPPASPFLFSLIRRYWLRATFFA